MINKGCFHFEGLKIFLSVRFVRAQAVERVTQTAFPHQETKLRDSNPQILAWKGEKLTLEREIKRKQKISCQKAFLLKPAHFNTLLRLTHFDVFA